MCEAAWFFDKWLLVEPSRAWKSFRTGTTVKLVAEARWEREIGSQFRNGLVLNYTYLHAFTRFYTRYLAVTLTCEMEWRSDELRWMWEKAVGKRLLKPALAASVTVSYRILPLRPVGFCRLFAGITASVVVSG
jgi:hypothetical protein